jgi:hypothetical protein
MPSSALESGLELAGDQEEGLGEEVAKLVSNSGEEDVILEVDLETDEEEEWGEDSFADFPTL